MSLNYRTLPNGDTVARPGELPAMLIEEEKFVPHVYDDEGPQHNPTIGYGFNLRNPNALVEVLDQLTVNWTTSVAERTMRGTSREPTDSV